MAAGGRQSWGQESVVDGHFFLTGFESITVDHRGQRMAERGHGEGGEAPGPRAEAHLDRHQPTLDMKCLGLRTYDRSRVLSGCVLNTSLRRME